jgi:signal transduction histidine kinase
MEALMPTTTKPAKGATRAPAARRQPSSLEYIQQALEDLDKARGRATDELQETIDSAIKRLRQAAFDLRSRAEGETSQLEESLERASDDVRRELARRAIRAQRTPDALTELSAEIRKRRSQIR